MSKKIISVIIAILFFTSLISETVHAVKKSDTEIDNFLNPPKESRPWVFMWWYDNVDKPAITEHLEELSKKGNRWSSRVLSWRNAQRPFLR